MISPASPPQPSRQPGTLAGGDVWSWKQREAWVQQVAQDLERLKEGQGNATGRLAQAIWDLFTIAGRPDRADFAAFETLPQGAGQVWQRACALDRRVTLEGRPLAAPLERLWQTLVGTSYPVARRRAQGLDLTAIERPPDERGIAAWQRRTAWIATVGSTLERLGQDGGNAIGRLGTALWALCRPSGQPDADAYAALGRLAKVHGPTTIWWRACGLSAQAAMQGLPLTRPIEVLQAAFAPAGRQERITSACPAPLAEESPTSVETQGNNGTPDAGIGKQPMSTRKSAIHDRPPPPVPPPHPSPEQTRVWQTVLDELKLQMTQGTFDTWLADTQASGRDGDTLIVAVPSIQAKAWLEGRLGTIVARTVRCVAGHLKNVRFVLVGETAQETLVP
jgi:hypothetical protein